MTTFCLYETPFRSYDAALGRFMQIDLLASSESSMSPYQYAGNSPVSFNDPTGLYKDYNAFDNHAYHAKDYWEKYDMMMNGTWWDYLWDQEWGTGAGQTGGGVEGYWSPVPQYDWVKHTYETSFRPDNVSYQWEVVGLEWEYVRLTSDFFDSPGDQNGGGASQGDESSGFWRNIGKGFSQYGQLWGDMLSSAYKYLTPNVYRIGTGPANGQGGPPARSGRRAVWVDWDVMTLIMLGFDQKAPTGKNAKDMTTDKNDIDALDQFGPTNTTPTVSPTDSTIYYYPWDSGVGYDSSFMKVGILGVWVPSGIPRRN